MHAGERELPRRDDSPHARRAVARYCARCGLNVLATTTSSGWRHTIPILFALAVAAVLGAALIGFYVLLAFVPMALLVLAMGPVLAESRDVPRCPRCRRETPHTTRAQAMRALESTGRRGAASA